MDGIRSRMQEVASVTRMVPVPIALRAIVKGRKEQIAEVVKNLEVKKLTNPMNRF